MDRWTTLLSSSLCILRRAEDVAIHHSATEVFLEAYNKLGIAVTSCNVEDGKAIPMHKDEKNGSNNTACKNTRSTVIAPLLHPMNTYQAYLGERRVKDQSQRGVHSEQRPSAGYEECDDEDMSEERKGVRSQPHCLVLLLALTLIIHIDATDKLMKRLTRHSDSGPSGGIDLPRVMSHVHPDTDRGQKTHRAVKMPRPNDLIDSSSEDKSNSRFDDMWKKEHSSSKTQSQTLLTALRNLIVPLIQNAVPYADLAESPDSPEAVELLRALQKYIASIIGGQICEDHGPMTKVMHIREFNPETSETQEEYTVKDDTEYEALIDTKPENDILANGEMVGSVIQVQRPFGDSTLHLTELYSILTIKLVDFTLLPDLLKELRERVFNLLPIRLLCFESDPNSDTLRTSLAYRSEVFAYLAKMFNYTDIELMMIQIRTSFAISYAIS
ncbi:hypothetical protein BDN70DRAFT_901518 [Pholiota conissans]|uniref:Uncharacterized protein n=1 Tax=Pholiota conissans TaxID=109636 RepID=A0A9P6CLJ3_9AGAR|nr:hypothetical protein BDN70DRAFT_901518 [Pholiota conissans]